MAETSKYGADPTRGPTVSDSKIIRQGPLRFLRFLDEVIALRNRVQAFEAGRLESQRAMAVETAVRKAEMNSRGLPSEEQRKRRLEAIQLAEANEASSRQLAEAKLAKFDAELKALNEFLYAVGPAWDKTSGVQDLEKRLRAEEERISAAQADLERRTAEIDAREAAAGEKTRRADELLARLDVARRAEELDLREEDLDSKLSAYEPQMEELLRAREEINRDFDQLGIKQAEFEKEVERLARLEEDLAKQKERLVDALAEEMAVPFKAFVRELLKPKGSSPPLAP